MSWKPPEGLTPEESIRTAYATVASEFIVYRHEQEELDAEMEWAIAGLKATPRTGEGLDDEQWDLFVEAIDNGLRWAESEGAEHYFSDRETILAILRDLIREHMERQHGSHLGGSAGPKAAKLMDEEMA